MKLVDWQSNPKLIRAARELRDDNETFGMMLEVARDESPVNGSTSFGSGEHQDSRDLGYIKGYHHLLNIFEAMWTTPRKQKPIESQFKPPEEE